jgi:peroxisomal 3,2-trans-enoyl-CoA isomerase
MAEDGILVEYKGNVAIITLNLPKKLNALNQEHYYKLATSLLEVAARDDITITVLTGKGRFFSAYVLPLPHCIHPIRLQTDKERF